METIFFGWNGYNRWGLYHIRRVEDRPVSAFFRALPGIVRPCSGACECALVYAAGIYSGAYARLYALVHGMVVWLEW